MRPHIMRALLDWQRTWDKQSASGQWDLTPLEMWRWLGCIYATMTPEEQEEGGRLAGLELDQLTPDKQS